MQGSSTYLNVKFFAFSESGVKMGVPIKKCEINVIILTLKKLFFFNLI